LGIALSARLWIPVAFRHSGIRFLSPPIPAVELGRSCVGLTGLRQTTSGLPCSATVRYDRVGCRLYPGTVVSMTLSGKKVPVRFITPSSSAILRRRGDIGASSAVHLHSSVRSFPCLWLPDDWSLLGFPFHFTPRRYRQRMERWEWVLTLTQSRFLGRLTHLPQLHVVLAVLLSGPRGSAGTKNAPTSSPQPNGRWRGRRRGKRAPWCHPGSALPISHEGPHSSVRGIAPRPARRQGGTPPDTPRPGNGGALRPRLPGIAAVRGATPRSIHLPIPAPDLHPRGLPRGRDRCAGIGAATRPVPRHYG